MYNNGDDSVTTGMIRSTCDSGGVFAIDDNTHTAVLDRFEDMMIVLLAEGEDDTVRKSVVD